MLLEKNGQVGVGMGHCPLMGSLLEVLFISTKFIVSNTADTHFEFTRHHAICIGCLFCTLGQWNVFINMKHFRPHKLIVIPCASYTAIVYC